MAGVNNVIEQNPGVITLAKGIISLTLIICPE